MTFVPEADTPGASEHWANRAALLVIAGFVLAQIVLIPRLNIHWDEYFYLSHIHSYLAGRLTDPLQTFHVHLLPWLPQAAAMEADQIVVGRSVMLVLELLSVWCVFRIARELGSYGDALFCAAMWCALGFALAHGMAFRTDPLAAAMMMGALALLASAGLRVWQAALAGLLAALGLLITIKAAFYLPAFVGIGLIQRSRGESWQRLLGHGLVSAAALAAAGLALYLWHTGTLATAVMAAGGPSQSAAGQAQVLGGASEMAGASAQKVFADILPRKDDIMHWLGLSLVPLGVLVFSLCIAVRQLFAEQKRTLALAMLLLAAPLTSLLFYRNAFAYFFPFIMLPVILAAMPGIARLKVSWRVLLLFPMAAMIFLQFGLNLKRDQVTQRVTSEAAYRMFPETTPYIDRNAMLSRYPMVSGFGSTWGLEGDRRGSRFAAIIKQHQPPLLIANTPVFQKALDPDFQFADRWLSDADTRALQEAYIHHWGLIYVAGKELSEESGSFELSIAGRYTLECEGQRVIDSAPYPCGEILYLTKGSHSWASGGLTLRYGDNLFRPESNPPGQPIYYGFWASD